ncbi:MAG: ribosomal RNA small subunit methyltransferase A [Acidobacteria bacterium]|nr:MAG: ribosomal RNA small subunit methyltransferase A [Acidobacteriota bacterium]
MKTKKHFGQHFLHDQKVIEKILALLDVQQSDRIVEIGPGPATLTKPLHQMNTHLTVIEIDGDMVDFLESSCFNPPIDIIHGDFLKLDLSPILHCQTKVISNLPYNTSVPITARMLHFSAFIPTMVLMYQKEVAQRIQASVHTRDYGPISVMTRFFYRVSAHYDVGPGAFQPPPKVWSRVLKLERLERPLIEPALIPHAQRLLNALFGKRRKMVRGTLKKYGQQNWQTIYNEIGNPTARPENLSPDFYARWVTQTEVTKHV